MKILLQRSVESIRSMQEPVRTEPFDFVSVRPERSCVSSGVEGSIANGQDAQDRLRAQARSRSLS